MSTNQLTFQIFFDVVLLIFEKKIPVLVLPSKPPSPFLLFLSFTSHIYWHLLGIVCPGLTARTKATFTKRLVPV